MQIKQQTEGGSNLLAAAGEQSFFLHNAPFSRGALFVLLWSSKPFFSSETDVTAEVVERELAPSAAHGQAV